MKLQLLVAIALLGAAVLPVHASENGYSTAYSRCMDASGGVTVAMLDCIASETQQHDARLNKAYQAAMTGLGNTLKSQLRDAQRLWLKYRDAECALRGSLTGGSIDRINAAFCFLDMTKERADDLEWMSRTDG